MIRQKNLENIAGTLDEHLLKYFTFREIQKGCIYLIAFVKFFPVSILVAKFGVDTAELFLISFGVLAQFRFLVLTVLAVGARASLSHQLWCLRTLRVFVTGGDVARCA